MGAQSLQGESEKKMRRKNSENVWFLECGASDVIDA